MVFFFLAPIDGHKGHVMASGLGGTGNVTVSHTLTRVAGRTTVLTFTSTCSELSPSQGCWDTVTRHFVDPLEGAKLAADTPIRFPKCSDCG